MFQRTFMEAFKVRKNSNITGKHGSVSTNVTMMPTRDRKIYRFISYAAAAYLVTNATLNFSFVYELFYHFPAPVAKTYYEAGVPQDIKVVNDQIIQNWNKVHEARKLLKTFNADE